MDPVAKLFIRLGTPLFLGGLFLCAYAFKKLGEGKKGWKWGMLAGVLLMGTPFVVLIYLATINFTLS